MAAADQVIERVTLADGRDLVLMRWDDHIAIEVGGRSLMSSHDHGSEDELGRVVADRMAGIAAPRVLIGGLGLGFTLRAALDDLPPAAEVVVAELLPAVVRWNRGEHGVRAGRPLDDRRVELVVDDVAAVIKRSRELDAIVLDVDNGPDALTHKGNANLYKRAGLARTRDALRPGGTLAVWSTFASKTFTTWLETVGFEVELVRAASTLPRGPRYYIWLATRV
jgi:spermidine synthase